MEYLEILGQNAKKSAGILNSLGQTKKNESLKVVAKELVANSESILKANAMDVQKAIEKGVKPSLIDRLKLTDRRIEDMAKGIEQVITLDDPIGQTISAWVRPNGLEIAQKRVPLGVIGIIFESRPNVTADAFSLCFKTGNATILRGGSDAFNSNKAIVDTIRKSIASVGLPADCVQLLEDTSRETATKLMKLNQYIDVLIPRGGAGLIKTVLENSTIPTIETGTGNCHIYVDEFADVNMAVKIIENAKTQRFGVCNACESLVVHKSIADKAIPAIYEVLKSHNVEVRGDEVAQSIVSGIVPATTEDWGTEYLDSIISIKVVNSIDEAIEHINTYSTKHSESIVTENYENSRKFTNQIDSSSVYVNASTRFTDGFEFGFGAEIGISTQKLHARGPMGLLALTTSKYVILGNGQVR